jgi:hypothetical protein
MASDEASEIPEAHRVNHGTRSIKCGSRGMGTGDLTLTKGKTTVIEQERCCGENTPQREEMVVEFTWSINEGQRKMQLEKEKERAVEGIGMTGINDAEIIPTSYAAASNKKALQSKQIEDAFNAHNDSNVKGKERSAGFMEGKLVNDVDSMDLVPLQRKL